MTDGDKAQGTRIDNKRFNDTFGSGAYSRLTVIPLMVCISRGYASATLGMGGSSFIHLSAQKYFANHGRAWERFAWLKARRWTTIAAALIMNYRR
jgi:glutamate-ammonia-ligase adenylyltransferase